MTSEHPWFKFTSGAGALGGLAIAGGLALAGAVIFRTPQTPQTTQLVRGNPPGEWRYWGADAWSTRYSPLDQINAANFNGLKLAWQWNAGEYGSDEYYRTTPLYANGRLLTVATTRRKAFAIDPATGKTIWQWGMEEGIRWLKAPRQFAGRGLAYWTDGREERAIVVTPGYHMASIDAKTGTADPKFGTNGIVDLEEGLGFTLVPLAIDTNTPLIISEGAPLRKAKPGEKWNATAGTGADGTVGIDPAEGQIGASSPAIIVGDVIIVGNSAMHGYYPVRLHNIPGFIRGFDVHTGKQLWKFNLIPQPGEFGAETWTKGSKVGSEGVGKNDAWAPYSADLELGLVYIPVGMPLSDEYGGHRPGNNLYGNSIVALDVKTGKRKWHFQTVHHDIWDYDFPMSPNLLDVTINGVKRKIIAQVSKQGWVYVFDRVTGQPIWPMPERAVAQSEVPGEKTAATQPIPTRPVPYAQQGLVAADLIDYTPALKDSALKLAQRCRMGPYFIPASPSDGKAANGGKSQYTCSWYAPGAAGGVNIDGGAAVDPETGMIYIGGQTGLGTIEVEKDPCSEHRYSQPHDSCRVPGALPPPADYARGGRGDSSGAGRGARGGGGNAARGGGGGGNNARGAGAGTGAATTPTTGVAGGAPACAAGGRGAPMIGGISIVKPKPGGGITAYNLNSGDRTWWIPNGGVMCTPTPSDPMFRGVTLPPQGTGGGQAQVMTTKTLTIYGTGRSGGPQNVPAQLYAVDKATGKQVGAVAIPSKTSAVPMTFMHQGKQYIVFAVGSGSSTGLVALSLPR